MASRRKLTVAQIQSRLAKRLFIESKQLRRAIDRNEKIKQYVELDKTYSKKYNEFVEAYNKATEGLDKESISSSRKRFEFSGEQFEIGTAKKFIDKKANFRTIHRYLNKLFPEIKDNYELGHKNISVLRANIALALDTSTFEGEERKRLLALYIIVQEIDKIDKIQGTSKENKDKLINTLKDIAASGPDVSLSWKKDVNVVKGVKGELVLELELKELNQFKGRLSSWVGEIFSSIIKGQTKSAIDFLQDIDIANLQGSPTIVDDIESLIGHTIVSGIKNGKVTTSKKFKAPKATSSRKSTRAAKERTQPKKKKNLRTPIRRADTSRQRGVSSSPLQLMVLINKDLPRVVAKNMQSPALNYRTGRFASSVRVTDVVTTPKGFPSMGYTYDKDRYQTFEPGFAQGSVDRDPRKLIDKSMREIAAQYAVGRFFTRRV
jgi:hypothetical protein